ncbi:hypothetical protein K438DRAFT_1984144 [Mycena galopus ATCC 62051]|nr:hypothetical protein K438DRAFT_1984144 [Mycena galopus ATCC 62051]
MSASTWPASLRTAHAVLAFLRDPSTPALATDIYNVDFKDGVYGSYATDETACTDDVGAPYYTYIVGQVSMLPTFEAANWRFRISGGGGAEEELGATFARQVVQLAAMVKEGDEEDFDLNRNNIAVENFTDADRYSLLGGTWIEFMMSSPPVYLEQNGALVRTQPKAIRDYPMKVGDWVLVRASVHRWDDRSGYNIRRFSIVPERIRMLDIQDLAGGETTEDDTLSNKSTDGKDDPRLAENSDDIVATAIPDEEGPAAFVAVAARPRLLKRSLSPTTANVEETELQERAPVPVTPKHKRARKISPSDG